MKYRHAFHAGNFADVMKHAALAAALARLTEKDRPLFLLDTHAGRGRYDLPETGGEAGAGIARLLAARVEASRAEAALPPIRPVPRDRPLPLSFSQERLWFLGRLDPESASYHVPRAIRMRGPLPVLDVSPRPEPAP